MLLQLNEFGVRSSEFGKRIVFGLLCLVLVSSCGFHPLYGTVTAGNAAMLASVDIAPIKGELGQRLKDALDDRFINGGSMAKKYILRISPLRTVYPVIIDKDRGISRYHVVIKTDYSLSNSSNGAVEDSGTITVKSSYNVVTSQYATFVAEQNADREAIEDLANRYLSKISLHLAKVSKGQDL